MKKYWYICFEYAGYAVVELSDNEYEVINKFNSCLEPVGEDISWKNDIYIYPEKYTTKDEAIAVLRQKYL